MKLEYLNNISDGGKYKDVVAENLIRLYDFTKNETEALANHLQQSLLINKQHLNLYSIDFIEPLNCQLFFQLGSLDMGIKKTDKPNVFICELTESTFTNMIGLMKAVSDSGYNWLCDTSADNIDFLYSAGGTW